MEEIFSTEEPAVACCLTAVPFHVEAQCAELAVLPEVERTGNLGVVSGGSVLVGVVDVVEEECASPFVSLEHLESCGEMTAIEVKHLLNVGLGFQSDGSHKHGSNKYDFFHNVEY